MLDKGRGINFAKQTTLYRKKEEKKKTFKGIAVEITFLILVVVALGAIILYKNDQTGRLADINTKIDEEVNKKDFDKLAKIFDATSRLEFVNKISEKQKFWSGLLQEIQGKMLASVRLKELDGSSIYNASAATSPALTPGVAQNLASPTDQVLTLSVISPSLSDIAKQIDSFEGSNKVKSVTVGDISLEEGGLNFSLKLTLTPESLDRGAYSQNQ